MSNTYACISAYRGWVLSLTLESVANDGLEGYVDLQYEGASMGRLAYASSFESADDALALLSEEAKAFVDDWHVRFRALEAALAET